MDIQTINLDNLGSSPSLKLNTESKSEKSGSHLIGVEMLMNDRKKPTDASSVSSPKSDINLGDLTSLEAELNDLSGSTKKTSTREARSAMFSAPVQGLKLDISDKGSLNSDISGSLGSGGSSIDVQPSVFKLNKSDQKKETTKTWDGYSKFNDIPVDPSKNIPNKPQLNQEEMLREKFKYLRKLEALEKKGVSLSKKYSMESNFVGIGAVFEWVAGTKVKAPEFLANVGLEWVFRLIQEPKRLYKRYLIDNSLFITYFLKQVLLNDKKVSTE